MHNEGHTQWTAFTDEHASALHQAAVILQSHQLLGVKAFSLQGHGFHPDSSSAQPASPCQHKKKRAWFPKIKACWFSVTERLSKPVEYRKQVPCFFLCMHTLPTCVLGIFNNCRESCSSPEPLLADKCQYPVAAAAVHDVWQGWVSVERASKLPQSE